MNIRKKHLMLLFCLSLSILFNIQSQKIKSEETFNVKEYPFSLKNNDIIQLQTINPTQIVHGYKKNGNTVLSIQKKSHDDIQNSKTLFKIEKTSNDIFNIKESEETFNVTETIFCKDNIQLSLINDLNSPSKNLRLCVVSKLRRGNLEESLDLLTEKELKQIEKNKHITVSTNFIINQVENYPAGMKPIFPEEEIKISYNKKTKTTLNVLELINKTFNVESLLKIKRPTKQKLQHIINKELTTNSQQIKKEKQFNTSLKSKKDLHAESFNTIEKYQSISIEINKHGSRLEKKQFLAKMEKTLKIKQKEIKTMKKIIKNLIL